METDNKTNGNSSNEVAEYYENIAATYDESRFNNSYGRFVDAEERRLLDRLIDVTMPTQRLEIACGTGRLTGYATHGLDVSENMMSLARQRHPQVEFRLASATDTGYDDESFDLIYSFHLLMHLDEATISRIIDEAHRLLRPGGRLIVDIPSHRRRSLLHHRQASWHGGTALSTIDILAMTSGRFALTSSHGIMMLPVHKLPSGVRHWFTGFDYALCGSCLKEYSSYIVFELTKI